jgi:hypothetical protein
MKILGCSDVLLKGCISLFTNSYKYLWVICIHQCKLTDKRQRSQIYPYQRFKQVDLKRRYNYLNFSWYFTMLFSIVFSSTSKRAFDREYAMNTYNPGTSVTTAVNDRIRRRLPPYSHKFLLGEGVQLPVPPQYTELGVPKFSFRSELMNCFKSSIRRTELFEQFFLNELNK